MTSYNQPLSGNEMPRFGGPGTFARLPAATDAAGLDACYVGIPMDIGTSNRAGTRHGPRAIRNESVMIRPYNVTTGARPFDSLQVADIGDVPINTFNLAATIDIIERHFDAILAHDCVPLALGGDHTMTWPILKAMAKKHGPVAFIHVDAHSDTISTMFGERIAHGCPFRRALEDGCFAENLVFQIGLRGGGYGPEDWNWGRERGFTVYPGHELMWRSLVPVMDEIRGKIGDRPTYLSYDIDSLDPAFAPGTGTVEMGGLNTWQALEIVRGCRGLNLVGCDLVEVSPPYDTSGNTALIGAQLLWEMLCVLPGVKY